MSKALPIDVNSRPVPVMKIGYGVTFNPGILPNEYCGHIVRFKAIGDTSFRLATQVGSEIVMNDGDTEYFYIPPNDDVEIISGSINIMK